MGPYRLSIIASFPPEEDSDFMSEVEVYIDVIHPEGKTIKEFVEEHEYLVSGMTSEHGITVEVAKDEDGSVQICLFDLEKLGDDFDAIFEEIGETFFNEATQNAGFVLMATGLTEQEIRVDTELNPASNAYLN
ncbi:MAG: hypothetical protein JWO15_3573 [Sphingomonadales bacterium]|nr:hypothetical protein [Sphingomonadales bacterium]